MRKKLKSTVESLRVIKKIAANQRGSKGLTAEYGAKLLCVRHRMDATGTKRLTTVELIVSEKVIHRRPGPTVDLRVGFQEKELRARLKAAGARWDMAAQLWVLRRSTALAMGLKQRIVPRRP